MFSFPEYPQGMCETMIMSLTAKNLESCKTTKKDFKKKKGENALYCCYHKCHDYHHGVYQKMREARWLF